MRQILVIRACAIGDFVLNLPALRGLQNMHPSARFTLVGNPSTLELARDFVAVESIYSIESQPWSRLFYEPVPELKFDSAIVWMKDPTVDGNLRVSGIPSVFRADPFPVYGHAADHLLRTLKLDRPGLPDLWLRRSDDIVIQPTSGGARKIWPYFGSLIERLPNAVVLGGNSPLIEVSRNLRNCRAYIGNDSGITHLAAYLGCPTIAIFGPTDPRVWGPLGRRSRIIWKSKLEDITVNEVLLALHRICGAELRS
jgi:heptosyltransferase-3